jgi:hypothetical protein
MAGPEGLPAGAGMIGVPLRPALIPVNWGSATPPARATLAAAARSGLSLPVEGPVEGHAMRQTELHGPDRGRLRIVTNDRGTEVLDAEGRVIASYGSDRHEEMIARYEEAGWRVADDRAVRPEILARTPPPPTPGADTVRGPQDLARPDTEDA